MINQSNSTNRVPRKYARHEVVTCPPPMRREYIENDGLILVKRDDQNNTRTFLDDRFAATWLADASSLSAIQQIKNKYNLLFNNYEFRLLTHQWTITDIRWFHQQTGGQWFATNAKAYYRSRALVEVFQSTGGVFFISSAAIPDTGRRVYEVYQFCPLTGEIEPRKAGMTKYRARKAARELSEGIAPTNEENETTPNGV